LSWIIKDLWKNLELRQSEYANFMNDDDRITAYAIINRIASDVGTKWSVFIQLNFPPGQSKFGSSGLGSSGLGSSGLGSSGLGSSGLGSSGLGHRNLTMLVFRDRKTFTNIPESEVKHAFDPLNPTAIDSTGFGYEGFRVRLSNGRIDCLPSGVHLWCEITPEILGVLDWLFANAYGIKQA